MKDSIATFGLTTFQEAKATKAHEDAPVGFVAVAERCREYGLARGNTGAGLLMHMIDGGEHFSAELAGGKSGPLGFFSTGSHWRGWVDETEEQNAARLAREGGDRSRIEDVDPPLEPTPVETRVGELVRAAGIIRLRAERGELLGAMTGAQRRAEPTPEIAALDAAILKLQAMAPGEIV